MRFICKIGLFLFIFTSFANASNDRIFYDRFDRDTLKSWRVGPGLVAAWDRENGYRSKGSLKIKGNSVQGLVESSPVPVKPGEYFFAEVWVRIEQPDDRGSTYITLDWYAGEERFSQTTGGSPGGNIMYIPNPIHKTTGWTQLLARGFAPARASSVRIVLHSDSNAGTAWFDDIKISRVPPKQLLGELDRKPYRPDPTRLRPADYVSVQDGHIKYKGKRFRVWSAQGNLVASTHADIDLEVKRFKELGFNGHRTLYWSSVDDNYTPGDLSTQDRIDYLFAALGRQGVFIWCDYLNGIAIRPDQVNVIDEPSTASQWSEAMSQSKEQIARCWLPLAWDARSQAIYHNGIKQVLSHRNPYNGLTYAEDPTFYCWELMNEEWWIMRILWGNHLNLPQFFQKGLYDKWNEWLIEQYGNQTRLAEAWGGLLEGESLDAKSIMLLPLLGDTDANQIAKTLGLNVKYSKLSYNPKDFSEARAGDVIRFLTEIHLRYKQEAAKVFKRQGRKGLGSQIVPLVYDTGYSGAVLPFYMHSFSDATAVGFYLDMSTHNPKSPTFPFTSALRSPPVINDWLDSKRVFGKPSFVYENMIFPPQKYRVEYFYRLLAFAAIQDFDVVDFHYYGHPLAFPTIKNPYTAHTLQLGERNSYPEIGLSMRTDEVMMSACKFAGEVFKRGYLGPALNPTKVTLGSRTMWSVKGLAVNGQLGDTAMHTTYHRGFMWAFDPSKTEDTVQGTLVSSEDAASINVVQPTEQISYRWHEGTMVIDDAKVKALVGFVPERFSFKDGLRLTGITINTPDGMPFVIKGERYAGIAITSLDGKSLNKSRRVLLSVANTSFNSGFKMDLENMAVDTDYAWGLTRSVIAPGGLPVLTGRVRVTLHAEWLTGRSYKMFDYNNNTLSKGVCRNGELHIPSGLPVYLVEITR